MKSKKLFGALLISLVLVLFPNIVKAEEVDVINVARIGETEYATLDEAVAAAESNDVIELLKDAETAGLNLNKNLTIKSAGKEKNKITFTKYGIALWGVSLDFENVEITMNGIGSTPYTAEWNWMAICASKNASLTLNNTIMTMDGTGAGNAHAIYFCSNNKLNIINGSILTIKNYQQDALEWDGGDGGYNVNIIDSTFVSDHNRSGFTGTFYATITKSTVNVINSTGNGSNGSHFIITDSTVNFNDNGAHGLSAGILTINNSTVNANNNGGNGIHTNNALTIVNHSEVTVMGNDCSISSKWTIPGAIHVGSGTSLIDETTTLIVKDNNGSGIYLKSGSLDLQAGTITGNIAVKLGIGGGVNNHGSLLTIADNVEIYNNRADIAADDIFNNEGSTIKFSNVGANWNLTKLREDEEILNDCSDRINGWYDDSESNRWEAHYDNEEENYIVLVESGEYTNQLAIKAAHDRGTVVIKYVDEEENEIADSIVLEPGISEDTFETSALDLTEKNYQFDKVKYETNPEDTDYEITTKVDEITGKNIETGEYIFGNVTIKYVYYKVGKLEVRFVDEEGNEIATAEKFTEKVGNTYQTYPNQIPDYELIKCEGEESGEYIDGTIVVTYVYAYVDGIGSDGELDIIVPPHTGVEVNSNINSFIFIVETDDKKKKLI